MTVTVTNLCKIQLGGCGRRHQVKVPAQQLEDWHGGTLIQHAMPQLTVVEREQLATGLCPDCQDNMYGDDE